MTIDEGFSQEQQDWYFNNEQCPFCACPEICTFPWQQVDAFAESREALCHFCGGEWVEVTYPDVGHRFLEIQKKNAFELQVTVTVTHRMRVRIRAKNETEALAKAQVMDFEKIVEDYTDDVQVKSVHEESVKPLEEQDRGE
jgi:hypothetical protein